MSQSHYAVPADSCAYRVPDAPPKFPEQVIGSYVIGDTIGRGSFGKVKKGYHLHTGELVAIKILNQEKLKAAKMDKKIHREIEILQLFSHPNICRLYEVISTPTDMYLIMEYADGGELYDYIVKKGRVREAEARYIFQQIVCAIEYCHHFRVVHRDLKPENILLGPGLQVKLIDFGLSNIMKDGEFLRTSCGSPNYAAPEVIDGKLYFGPEVDVWSCGIVLYALLCGCLPFDEDNIPLLFTKIKKGRYSIPDSMPAAPRELIQQILVVDPLVRLTIPQIRDNVWFNQLLPVRLSYNESLFSAREDRIISVLVSETAKRMGLRDRDVRRELELGVGTAYVAYNILLDSRRRREIAAEVRELNIAAAAAAAAAAGATEDSRGASGHPKAPKQPAFQPKAMERELNMGLMLAQSPAMEVLLGENDASTNKYAYNSGSFVPASASTLADPMRSSDGCSDASGPTFVGSFRMTAKVRSGSLTGHGSMPSSLAATSLRGGSSSFRRPGMITGGSAASQLGANISEQSRVGSVARKHTLYTAEEEKFIVENNYGWRIGLMTDLHAEKALSSIYAVLRSYGLEWKMVSPFQLLIRTTAETWEILTTASQSISAAGRILRTGPGSSLSSSAPIRIGAGAAGSASSEDPEGEDIAGSLQRDEGSFHPRTARPRRPGASPYSAAGSAGLRGNYFGDLQPTKTGSSPSTAGTSAASPSLKPKTDVPVSSPVRETSAAVPPKNPVILSLYFFRIQEQHDKGYLVDFKVVRNVMVAMDLILVLSDALIRKIG